MRNPRHGKLKKLAKITKVAHGRARMLIQASLSLQDKRDRLANMATPSPRSITRVGDGEEPTGRGRHEPGATQVLPLDGNQEASRL